MERRMIGSVELVALVDTVQTFPATAIYPEAGETLSRFKAYCDADGGVALNFACFLVRDGSTTILVDTGYGPGAGGKLLEEMEASGFEASDVDIVTFTHLHGDHTAWNIDAASGAPTFPNARYLVPRKDWEHFSSETPVSASFERDMAPLERLRKLELIDGEATLSAAVTAVSTPGHTPGHTSFAITSGGEHGFVLGDIVLTRIDAEEPGLVTAFDFDRLMAVETRRKVIARLVADGALVGASHLPVPGLGRFAMAGGGSRWEPA